MPTTTGCLTNAAEQLILDHVFNSTSWTLPTCYLGLLIATPTDAGGTEVTTAGTNGYARQAVGTGGSSIFNAASSGSTSTNANVTWGPSTGGPWSTVAYWGLFDASTAGNLLAYGDITDGSVGTDDSYRITSGNLTLSWNAATKWTNTFKNLVLDHITGRTSFASPTVYLGLYEGDPLGAGVETETAGSNGYSRQALAAALGSASGGSITNSSAAITFGPASANWGTIDYFSIHSASTAGTLYAGAALSASKTVNSGDSLEFATSQLTLTLD